MNLLIKKEILNENLNYISKALDKKNIIPVLAGINFNLTKKGLYLTSTDDDITIQTFISKEDIIEIIEEGNIIIPGRIFIDIIRKIPSDEINLFTDGLILNIISKNSKYNLNGMHFQDFPDRDLKTTKNPLILSSKIIKNLINQTVFSVSNQESRPVLTGVNVLLNENKLTWIATDSYRLSKKEITIDTLNDINIIIPGKNLIELSKILEDEESDVEIHIFNNNVLFKFSNILFQSKLLNGSYPDTSKLIEEKSNNYITININEFYNMIDRASILTSEKDKNVIKLDILDKEIIVRSDSQEIGNIEEKMTLDTKDVKLKIAFSSKYMMEALRAFKSETINIYFTSDIKPIILKNEEESLIQLIVPIKIF